MTSLSLLDMAAESTPIPQRTRDRILDYAEEMFAERGYRGTSLAEIADLVGIRGPSLFSHFKNKRVLYEAVMERGLDPFFALLEELAELSDTRARAGTIHARLMQHNSAHPRLSRLIQQAVLAGGEQLELLVERWYRPYSESLTELLSPTTNASEGDSENVQARRSQSAAMALNTLILGYFTLAPLHAKLLGIDPLSPDALRDHTAILQSLDALLRTQRNENS